MRRHVGGFTLVETLFVLIIAAIGSISAMSYYNSYLDNLNSQVAADQTKIITDASSKYIKDNFASVLAVAGPTAPANITVPMLISTGYLPNGFATTNSFNQTYLILARKPVANQLETMVVTTGGQKIPELGIRRISQLIGAKGGYISTTNPNVVQGSTGGWQTAVANFGIAPGAGHYASSLFFQDGQVINDYLYRNAIPGHPELNAMNTALNMNGNNISNANTVGAVTVNSTNINATNAALTNVTSTNVTSANVTATNLLQSNGTTRTAGDTYTGNWFRTQGDTGWYSEKWGGGWYMSDPTWIRAYNDKSVYTAGEVQAGAVTSNGRATLNEYAQINGIATAGTGCSPNGLVGRTGAGDLLACKNGIWTAGGFNTTLAACSASGTFFAGCQATCPAGTKVLSGGCQTPSNSWEMNNSYPSGNGWYCEGSEDYGTGIYNISISGYAVCGS
jgi:type II secretory pathway pseudopilin PulG